MGKFIRFRKWKLAALGLFAVALFFDSTSKRLAAESAIRIDYDLARVAGYAGLLGFSVALIGMICGVVSVVMAERGLVAPLIVLGCSYLLVSLILV